MKKMQMKYCISLKRLERDTKQQSLEVMLLHKQRGGAFEENGTSGAGVIRYLYIGFRTL